MVSKKRGIVTGGNAAGSLVLSSSEAGFDGRTRLNALVIDVGGTSVKIRSSQHAEVRSFRSGPALTPKRMVAEVKDLAADWMYEVVTIGYPGPVLGNQPTAEPINLGPGWVEFDYSEAFGRRVKIINDAAMQALGSYQGGKMLFLGLGTGLGTTLIVDGNIEPMELGHLPYKAATYEYYVGRNGLERDGKIKWRRHVMDVVERLVAALRPEYTVLGGGNVNNLSRLPGGCTAGTNANAFAGGTQVWNDSSKLVGSPRSRKKREITKRNTIG